MLLKDCVVIHQAPFPEQRVGSGYETTVDSSRYDKLIMLISICGMFCIVLPPTVYCALAYQLYMDGMIPWFCRVSSHVTGMNEHMHWCSLVPRPSSSAEGDGLGLNYIVHVRCAMHYRRLGFD